MQWSDLGSAIGKLAPIVGTALGGPVGAAVGTLVSSALGVENTPEAVDVAIKANPELLLKVKTLEFDAHKLEVEYKEKVLLAKQAELDSILADVNSARQRQTAHENATGKSDVNLYVLAWVTIIGFFILIGILMFVQLPTGNDSIVHIALGILSGAVASVFGYFFGSSKGSADKTRILGKLGSSVITTDKEKI